MGEKDIAEQTLLDNAEVFADVHNALYYGGNPVIRPEDLVPLPGISAYTRKGKLRKQERDVVKLWKSQGVCLALWGIENQTRPDADIALRMMSYDGAAYRSQLLDKSEKLRYPVISTVLYFGRTHWRAAKSLKERLTIPQALLPYVNDYKVNVVEVSFLTPEQISYFHSDFRSVADYFVNSRMNKGYRGSREQITHVVEFFQLMKVLTGDKRFDNMDFDALQKGEHSMYSLIDRWLDTGRTEGISMGINKGREEGLALGINKGRAEGLALGINKGRAEERAVIKENIQMLLNSGQITEETATLLLSNLK